MNPSAHTNWLVRDAAAGDLDWLVHGCRALASETEAVALDAGVVRRGVQRVLQDDARGRYLIAQSPDGDTVGQMMLTHEWSDWRDGWFWWIQSVYIAQDRRRQGVYRALYDAVLRQAESADDVCGIRLYVDADNEIARRTYRSLDMKETEYVMMEVDFSAIRDDAPSTSPDA